MELTESNIPAIHSVFIQPVNNIGTNYMSNNEIIDEIVDVPASTYINRFRGLVKQKLTEYDWAREIPSGLLKVYRNMDELKRALMGDTDGCLTGADLVDGLGRDYGNPLIIKIPLSESEKSWIRSVLLKYVAGSRKQELHQYLFHNVEHLPYSLFKDGQLDDHYRELLNSDRCGLLESGVLPECAFRSGLVNVLGGDLAVINAENFFKEVILDLTDSRCFQRQDLLKNGIRSESVGRSFLPEVLLRDQWTQVMIDFMTDLENPIDLSVPKHGPITTINVRNSFDDFKHISGGVDMSLYFNVIEDDTCSASELKRTLRHIDHFKSTYLNIELFLEKSCTQNYSIQARTACLIAPLLDIPILYSDPSDDTYYNNTDDEDSEYFIVFRIGLKAYKWRPQSYYGIKRSFMSLLVSELSPSPYALLSDPYRGDIKLAFISLVNFRIMKHVLGADLIKEYVMPSVLVCGFRFYVFLCYIDDSNSYCRYECVRIFDAKDPYERFALMSFMINLCRKVRKLQLPFPDDHALVRVKSELFQHIELKPFLFQ